MKKLLAMLLLAGLVLAGCGNEQTVEIPGSVGGEQTLLGAALADWTAAAQHNFLNAESVSMSVPPDAELIKAFWDTARMDNWIHLPEFAEGEPADVADYWFLFLVKDVVGLDENGYWVWAEDIDGEENAGVPKEEVDEFVHTHFGDVALQHEVGTVSKMYSFDGENYYNESLESFPKAYYGLTELLLAEGTDGQVVYTALLNDYDIEYSETAEKAIMAAYGDQIESGELTYDEAAAQMVMGGQTDEFEVVGKLEVKFYLDDNGEVVYLAVSRHYDPEYSLLG